METISHHQMPAGSQKAIYDGTIILYAEKWPIEAAVYKRNLKEEKHGTEMDTDRRTDSEGLSSKVCKFSFKSLYAV